MGVELVLFRTEVGVELVLFDFQSGVKLVLFSLRIGGRTRFIRFTPYSILDSCFKNY
jgi:hypothetical protein